MDEDQTILKGSLDWLLIETEPPRENSWEESLVQLIKRVQKVNQRTLAWIVGTTEGTGEDATDQDNSDKGSC